jgi:hypothetical protein
MCLQQPATTPLLHVVHGVARGALHDLEVVRLRVHPMISRKAPGASVSLTKCATAMDSNGLFATVSPVTTLFSRRCVTTRAESVDGNAAKSRLCSGEPSGRSRVDARGVPNGVSSPQPERVRRSDETGGADCEHSSGKQVPRSVSRKLACAIEVYDRLHLPARLVPRHS